MFIEYRSIKTHYTQLNNFMRKTLTRSLLPGIILMHLLLAFSFTACDTATVNEISGNNYSILPADSDSEADKKWAQYLCDHLQRRGGDDVKVKYGSSSGKKVAVHIDAQLPGDFKIENKDDNSMVLTAKDERIITWLLYQFMRKVGDSDSSFSVSDLPMSLLSFNDTIATFAFRYRDVYLPTNLDPEMSAILGTHNLDHDWGLWGHNLHKVLPDEPDEEVFALSDGKRVEEQYCFSSDKLYNYIVDHLDDEHDSEHCHHNFAIIPNDNDIVCMCPECVKAGNDKTAATPAVIKMLRRLAERFPTHKFFTLAYRTTRKVCKEPLPDNCGVLVSAIHWPLGSKIDDKVATKFRKKITEWQQKTENVYIWDYINNFDDYLTPFPILRTMKYRLQTYCDLGVKGVFLNGSGYDYSTFEYFHTCILSALMLNPYMSLKQLVDDHFKRRFPVAGDICKEYYRELMNSFEESGKIMTWYSGIEDTEEEFLNRERFIVFYKKLNEIVKETHDEEEFRLRRLITALTFTRLEIARHAGFVDSIGYAHLDGNTIKPENKIINYLHRLADNHKLLGFSNYTETGETLEEYIRNWKKLVLVHEHYNSLLFGKELTIHNNGKNQKSDKLTDGQPGLPDSYHSGWLLLHPSETQITIPGKLVEKACAIRFNFLQMPRHRISVPTKVEIWQNGKRLRIIEPRPASTKNNVGIAFCDIKIGVENGSNVTLKISPSAAGHNIAIDEIYLEPKQK